MTAYEKGTKVIHKNHRDWGVGIVIAPAKTPKKVCVKFNLISCDERPCTITNLEEVPNKKYLTDDEAEKLKAACSDEDERAVLRDMLDTGMTLKEALDKRKYCKQNEAMR